MKIFVSYSLRDGCVTQSHLERLRNMQQCYPNISVYIDFFDNPYGYIGGEKSLCCPAHKHVLYEISKADIVLLLSDPSVSNWVSDELDYAKKLGIPVQKIMVDDVYALLYSCSIKTPIASNMPYCDTYNAA